MAKGGYIDSRLYSEVLQGVELAIIEETPEETCGYLLSRGIYAKVKHRKKKKLILAQGLEDKVDEPKLEEYGEVSKIIDEAQENIKVTDEEDYTESQKETLIDAACEKFEQVILESKLDYYSELLSCIKTRKNLFFYKSVNKDLYNDYCITKCEQELEDKRMETLNNLASSGKGIYIYNELIVASIHRLNFSFLLTLDCKDTIDLIWKHFEDRLEFVSLNVKLLKISLNRPDREKLTVDEIKYFREIKKEETIRNPGIQFSIKTLAKQNTAQLLQESSNKARTLQESLDFMVNTTKKHVNTFSPIIRRVKRIQVKLCAKEKIVNGCKEILSKGNRGKKEDIISLNSPDDMKSSIYIY